MKLKNIIHDDLYKVHNNFQSGGGGGGGWSSAFQRFIAQPRPAVPVINVPENTNN